MVVEWGIWFDSWPPGIILAWTSLHFGSTHSLNLHFLNRILEAVSNPMGPSLEEEEDIN